MRLPLPVAGALLASLMASLVGCGGDGASGKPPPSADPATLVFVEGAAMTPTVDGSSARIIHGPQGGYHFEISLLARHIWPGTPGVVGSPDNPITTLHAFRADGSEITLALGDTSVLRVAWERLPDGYLLRERQLRLDTTTPAALDRESMRLTAEVVDHDGKRAMDEEKVVALKPLN